MKRILLLGASGRTGKHVLDYALAQGLAVTALVRDPQKITLKSDQLTLIKGTPEKAEDVMTAIEGCTAVISVLNNPRASDAPWAKIVGSPTFLTTSVQNTVAAMKQKGLRRIVVMTADGVGDSFAHSAWILRLFIRKTNLKVVYADHETEEQALRDSHLDWTALRAVGLSDGKVKSLIVSYAGKPKPKMMISRQHVAKFAVDCLDQSEYFGKAPTLSEK